MPGPGVAESCLIDFKAIASVSLIHLCSCFIMLSVLKEKSTTNILVIGETGVGKSTFINSLANYCQFNSLQDALDHESLVSLIGSSMWITDDNFNEIVVKIPGHDDALVQNAGKSVTTTCRTYDVSVNEWTVRLIDTPGLADTRGFDKDCDNIELIMNEMINTECLHGILILLKPNEGRLSLMFRYTINEFLTRLSKRVVPRIAFGFTNTRGTLYKPGETLRCLKELLASSDCFQIDQQSLYCFDSECFRFLAAVRQGVDFDTGTKDRHDRSWDVSASESFRLIRHFQSMQSHDTSIEKNMMVSRINLRTAAGKLTHVNEREECQRHTLDFLKSDVKKKKQEIASLETRLWIPKKGYEQRRRGTPSTVCTNQSCIQIIRDNGVSKTKHLRECHRGCYCGGGYYETVNNARLMNCSIMEKIYNTHSSRRYCGRCGGYHDDYQRAGNVSGGRCSSCGHGYQEHMTTWYETIEVSSKEIDVNVGSRITAAKKEMEEAEYTIRAAEQQMKNLLSEKATLQNSNKRDACYILQNAIKGNNEALNEFIQHWITSVKEDINRSTSDSKLQAANDRIKWLEQYQKDSQEEAAMIQRSATV